MFSLTKRIIIKIIFSIIFASFFTGYLYTTSKDTMVTIKSNYGLFSLFYDRGKGFSEQSHVFFNEATSDSEIYVNNFGHWKNIKKIRIDIDAIKDDRNISIEYITLIDLKTNKAIKLDGPLLKESICKTNNINKIDVQGKKLVVFTNGTDPYFILSPKASNYHQMINTQGKEDNHFFTFPSSIIFIVVQVLIFLIIFYIIISLLEFLICKNQQEVTLDNLLNDKFSKSIFFISILSLFLLAYYISSLVPYGIDTYRVMSQTKNVSFLKYMLNRHLAWNPRLGEILLVAAIYFPKINNFLYNIINSLALMINVFSIFYLMYNRLPSTKKITEINIFILIFYFYLFLMPVTGQTIFWRAGAYNYNIPFVIYLLFLIQYKNYYIKSITDESKLKITSLFFLGLFAGQLSEIGSPTLIAFVIIIFLLSKINKKDLPLGFFSGAFGLFISVIYLIINMLSSARIKGVENFQVIDSSYIIRIIKINSHLLQIMTPVIILLLFFLFLNYLLNNKSEKIEWINNELDQYKIMSSIFIFLSFFSISGFYILKFYTEDRTFFIAGGLLIIGLFMLIKATLIKTNLTNKRIFNSILISIIMINMFISFLSIYIILPKYIKWNNQTEYIIELIDLSKKTNNTNVIVPRFTLGNGSYLLSIMNPIHNNADHGHNKIWARYWKIESIKTY